MNDYEEDMEFDDDDMEKMYHFQIFPSENNELKEIDIKADRIELPQSEDGDRASYKLYRDDKPIGEVIAIWVLAWWVLDS